MEDNKDKIKKLESGILKDKNGNELDCYWNDIYRGQIKALKKGLTNKYKFKPPKYFVNDWVWFRDNKKFELKGIIVRVETHWNTKNESYHIYSIFSENRKRKMYVGEKNIFDKYKF